MAIVVTTDNRKYSVPAKIGEKLWKALQYPETADEETLEKLKQIKAIYLNWHTAPDDYIKENLETIIPIALCDWKHDQWGKPIKPQSDHAWKFAKRWGLWLNGQATELVTGIQYVRYAPPGW